MQVMLNTAAWLLHRKQSEISSINDALHAQCNTPDKLDSRRVHLLLAVEHAKRMLRERHKAYQGGWLRKSFVAR